MWRMELTNMNKNKINEKRKGKKGGGSVGI